MARKREYVNNARLHEELAEYKKLVSVAEENATPTPPIPEYVGEAILKIAENLAKKPNFSGYSFKEDMIGDGIENCLHYLHNFDPVLYSNPFSYFTQIIKFAFIRRIQSESTQSYVKYKSLQSSDLFTNHKSESKKHVNLIHTVMNEVTHDIIRKYEERVFNKKKKLKEQFLGATGIIERLME